MNGTIECAFVGAVASDITMRVTKTGKAWANFSVAVGDGDSRQFVRVAVFGEHAPAMADLSKGSNVYVEGKITLSSWTDKEGNTRHGLNVGAFIARPLGQIGQRRPKREKSATGDTGDNHQPSTQRSSARRDYARPLLTGDRAAGARHSAGLPSEMQAIPF